MPPPRRAGCPSRRTRRCGRSAAWRRAASPAARRPRSTAPGSPPHSSRIIAVAASTASGISAGSMPRSKRWRASETIWCRRPVSATRTGSNSAHSTNTAVVASSQPVGLAADHAGHRLHAGGVGDDAVLRRRRCSPCRSARGTFRRAPRRSVSTSPVSFAHVEHVQRAAEVDGEEVRHVHQRVDRPQPDRRSAGPAAISGWGRSSRRGWCGRGSTGRLRASRSASAGRRRSAARRAPAPRLQRADARRRPGRARCHARRSSRRGWG